jgi:hypothetical protein
LTHANVYALPDRSRWREVRRHKFPVCDERILGLDDRLNAAAQEFGTIGAERARLPLRCGGKS